MKDSSHKLKERILEAAKNNFDIKKLYEKHQSLDIQIEKMTNKAFLTNEEQAKLKTMKVEKLSLMDKIIKSLPD